MKKLKFLFTLLLEVFYTMLVFLEVKKTSSIENISAVTCRSGIPTLRECQKAQSILNILDVAIDFSPKILNAIFSARPQSSKTE